MRPWPRSSGIAFLASLAAFSWADAARAQDPQIMKHASALGDAYRGVGWSEIVVQLRQDAVPFHGSIRIERPEHAREGLETEFPLSLSPKAPASISLPFYTEYAYSSSFDVQVLNDARKVVAQSNMSVASGEVAPTLFVAKDRGRMFPVLRGWSLGTSWLVGYGHPGGFGFQYGLASNDATTGDLILPLRPAGYAGTTVVWIPSDQLVKLGEPMRDALLGWTGAGGTLALTISRKEDLRHPVVVRLLGGVAEETEPSRSFLRAPISKPTSPVPSGTAAPSVDPELGLVPPVVPGTPLSPDEEPVPFEPENFLNDGQRGNNPFIPIRTDGIQKPVRPPSEPMNAAFAGVKGAGLRESEFGATAAFGLGEVHVIPFDPDDARVSDDPRAQSRMVAILTHAWNRKRQIVSQHGWKGTEDPYQVKTLFDPNRTFEWPLGFAALALVLYSIVSGPLLFRIARLREKPLLPLVVIPVFSVLAFVAIVIAGFVSKGFGGHSARATFIEARAGHRETAVRKLRAFFLPSAESLRIEAEDERAVLRVFRDPSAFTSTSEAKIQFNAGKLVLHDVRARPYQTNIVIEETTGELAGTVNFYGTGAATEVENKLGEPLLDVMAYAPAIGVLYFPKLDPGQRVLMSSGHPLFTPTHSSGPAAYAPPYGAALDMAPGAREDAKRVWNMFGSHFHHALEWWPSDVPILLAELDTPKGTSDTGFKMKNDRTVVRIVGTHTPATALKRGGQ